MPTASPAVRYRLKVSLRRISPMIWRRLLVPSDLTLHGLYRTIQIAFGWEDWFGGRGQAVSARTPFPVEVA